MEATYRPQRQAASEGLPAAIQVRVDRYLRDRSKRALTLAAVIVPALVALLTFLGVESVTNSATIEAQKAVDAAVAQLREGRLRQVEQQIESTAAKLRESMDALKGDAIAACVTAKAQADNAVGAALDAETRAKLAKQQADEAGEVLAESLAAAERQKALLPQAAAFLEKTRDLESDFGRWAEALASNEAFLAQMRSSLERAAVAGPRGPAGPSGPVGPPGPPADDRELAAAVESLVALMVARDVFVCAVTTSSRDVRLRGLQEVLAQVNKHEPSSPEPLRAAWQALRAQLAIERSG